MIGTGEVALVGLRCRTADPTSAALRGVEALTSRLGRRLGVDPRLIGSPAPADEERLERFEADLEGSRGCLLEAGGQVDDALIAGKPPVLVAGDPAIGLTTLPTVARLRPDAKVLWLDAHGGFHTPQSTPDGYLGGMALAGACGCWPTGFEATIDPARVVLCGVRDLDRGERELLERSRATVIGTALEALVYLQNALDGAPTYVHLDVDVLDPEIVPARHAVPGGLGEDKVYDLLDAASDSCEVVGLEIVGVQAPEDRDDAELLAELVAHIVDPLLPHD